MELDLRLRLFTTVLTRVGRASVARMTPDDLVRLRRQPIPRGPVLGRLFGRVAPGVRREDRQVPGRGGPIGVRLYRPEPATPAAGGPAGQEPLPLVVNFHGGGWAIGSLDAADWLCSEVAASTPAVVASVDYRLAPHDPYPAGREDCYDATRWLAEHARDLGADPDRVVVMGDSAGGNLAAVVTLLAREAGGPRLAAQVLIYPATDATGSRSAALDDATLLADEFAPMLPQADRLAYLNHYLGPEGDRADPLVSPLLAPDLSGLPPALVITAEHDPLRHEGRAYADRLAEAGVPTRFTEYVGMVHGFVTLPGLSRSAPQAVAEIVQALQRLRAPLGPAASAGAAPAD